MVFAEWAAADPVPVMHLESYARAEEFREWYFEMFEDFRKRSFGRALSLLEAKFPNRGRILDIGCSYGIFLDMARRRGWDVSGIEGSPHEVEYCRSELNLDVQQGNIDQLKLPQNSFTVITLWDVLEHSLDPVTLLRMVQRALTPGGVILIRVPDRDGIVPICLGLLYTLTFGRFQYPIEKLFEFHWFHFNRRTLEEAMEKAGLQADRWYGEDYINLEVVHKKPYGRFPPVRWALKGLMKTGQLVKRQDELVMYGSREF